MIELVKKIIFFREIRAFQGKNFIKRIVAHEIYSGVSRARSHYPLYEAVY
jgi:hypothetical protein